jgi:hygromycin-B 7''-O-kinase
MSDSPHLLSTPRLGTIRADRLQAALDRFDLGALLAAEPIPFGLFGQNVFLQTDRGRYVLRACSHYPWQFPKERFFANLLHERSSAPIPWPYLVETSPDVLGWDFAIMPCLPGIALADQQTRVALPDDEQREIARALGAMLAEIHRVELPYPGEYDLASDDLVPLDVPYSDLLVGQTREWVTRACRHSDRTTDSDVAWVDSIINQARDALQVPFAPVPLHGDYAYNNALARRTKSGWQCSGVVDLMNMSVGDGEGDLALLTRMYVVDGQPDCARAFLTAYLERHRPRRLFLPRFTLNVLIYILIGWEYGQRHPELGWFDPDDTLRSWAEPVVRQTRDVAAQVLQGVEQRPGL